MGIVSEALDANPDFLIYPKRLEDGTIKANFRVRYHTEKSIIGRRFKRRSKYGLSTWEDVVSDVIFNTLEDRTELLIYGTNGRFYHSDEVIILQDK